MTQNPTAAPASEHAGRRTSTEPSPADIREADRAIRTARLHATGSWLVVLAVILSTQRPGTGFVEAAVCVSLAIGAWAGLEKLRSNVVRKAADPITGQPDLPGGPLPLAAKTRIGFAFQVLAAMAVLVLLRG